MTKEIPKEMLPIATYEENVFFLKPMLQLIFEHLFDDGVRQFCIITGRGKRSIEDHFTPDSSLVKSVDGAASGKSLTEFFRKLEGSRIYFVNQSTRMGFGDAVLHAEDFVGNDSFLVHAGDDFILSGDSSSYAIRLNKTFVENDADAVLLAERSRTPQNFGVIVGDEISPGLHSVRKILEKPKEPPSNLTVIAVYMFRPIIFEMIRSVAPDLKGEVQLTSAIQLMIERGCKVFATELMPKEKRVEIGTPDSYLNSLLSSMKVKE
jgi:UTP--glucose-1-phosphate uridylyltransferase